MCRYLGRKKPEGIPDEETLLAFRFSQATRTFASGHAPDVKAAAATMARCGIEEIITFAKGHDGFAYYPSAVGTVHPRMKGDAFGDFTKACKKKDIRVLAYVSFGIDGEAGRKHPDWVQVGIDGAQMNDDWFISVCPFTPYLDELMLPQLGEILAWYPVDGFFFDTMGAMGICYCAWCEKDFAQSMAGRFPVTNTMMPGVSMERSAAVAR